MKHLLPVRSEIVMEAENNKLEYENKLKAMKELSKNTIMNDKEKRSLINSMGMEAEDLMSDINEYEGMKKDISNDKRKVTSAVLNATKAASYWRNENAVKYGEWLIIEMVGKRLLEKYDGTEANNRTERASDSTNAHLASKSSVSHNNDSSASTSNAINIESDMDEDRDLNVIDVDNMFHGAKKAKPDRNILRKVTNTKYQWSKEFKYITYQDFKNNIRGGKQGRRKSLIGEGFEWNNGCVTCTLCNQRFRNARSLDRHTEDLLHIELIKKNKEGTKRLHQRSLLHEDSNIKGISLSNEE